MKLKLNAFVFFAAMLLVLGSAAVCFGQEDDEAGGYVSVSTADAGVKSAADFAVRKNAAKQNSTINLLSIKSARMQVVAGVNYELCMEVSIKGKDDDEAVEKFIKAVVYKNLQNVFSLTSWAEEDCAE